MADDFTVGPLAGLDQSLTQDGPTKKERNDSVEKNEFITLLVTQLKNQDPLDPMENDEFAVKLAQFSQLEQLVAINEKLGDEGGGGINSMAGYLGHEVTLNTNEVSVSNFDGGEVKFELDEDAASVALELVDSSGQTRETIDLGPLSAGKHSIQLSELATESGEFTASIVGIGQSGASLEPEVRVAGTVSGFIPGPEPTLLLGNREVSPSEIVEVAMAAE